MKCSKQEVISSLKLIATDCLEIKSEAFDAMYNNSGIVEVTKNIVYLMFVNEKSIHLERNFNVYKAMITVRDYCKELHKYGEVNFL